MKRLLNELGVPISRFIKMFCDKMSATSMAKNLVDHDRTNHMEIDRQLVKAK